MGSIFPRLAEIQTAMGVGEGALGFALIGTPVGTLISLTLNAPVLERFGHRRLLLSFLVLLPLIYAAASFAPTPAVLFFALIPVGLTIGCIEVIVNTEADRVEHQMGFRIMNRSHAFWSFGFMAAGLFGALMARLGVSPQVHLLIVVPLCTATMWLCLSRFQPAPHRPGAGAEAAPMFALPSLGILILVAMTLSAMLLEGASLDWSAIYMRNEYASPAFLGGVTVALFALSQATARFVADRFVDRYNPVNVARTLILVMAAGCLLVTFGPFEAASMLGFAMMGVGCSALFPLAMSAAAQRPDRSAVVNIAALAQTAFVIFLLGPPLLGFVAEHYGIRTSFALGLPLIVLSLLTVGSLDPARSSSKA
jgi:MFS family permease